MTERITCPYCDHSIDLDIIDMAGLWKERAALAARFGGGWKIVNEYVEAFRVRPGARMALKKRLRHLEELAKLWETGVFEYDGRRYRVGKDAIMAAMQKVCNAEKTGFKDHAYLKVVLKDGAERVSAEGLTAKEEVAREGNKRRTVGATPRGCPDDGPVDAVDHKKRLGEIVERIGRPMT